MKYNKSMDLKLEKKVWWNYIEEDLQCTSGTMGDFNGGSGTAVNLEFFFGANLTGLFDNVNTLSPGINIHRIGSGEWVDNFDRYDVSLRVILTDSTQEKEITDRWVNKNAIIPLGNADTDMGRFFGYVCVAGLNTAG